MKGLDFVASHVFLALGREFPFSFFKLFCLILPQFWIRLGIIGSRFCESTPFRAHLVSQVFLNRFRC